LYRERDYRKWERKEEKRRGRRKRERDEPDVVDGEGSALCPRLASPVRASERRGRGVGGHEGETMREGGGGGG